MFDSGALSMVSVYPKAKLPARQQRQNPLPNRSVKCLNKHCVKECAHRIHRWR